MERTIALLLTEDVNMPAFLSAISMKTMAWLLLVLLATTFSFGALTVVMY